MYISVFQKVVGIFPCPNFSKALNHLTKASKVIYYIYVLHHHGFQFAHYKYVLEHMYTFTFKGRCNNYIFTWAYLLHSMSVNCK